jgi:putative frv operon regulatory protein
VVKNVITIKNIITAAGTEQIKTFSPAFIRQQPRFFSQQGSFHYANTAGETGRVLSGTAGNW